MGNCQAAEAATVVIQHPGKGTIERIYWSVSANEVMTKNPGHYVALLVTSQTDNGGPPLKQLKLLRPDDTLLIGHVYRLVSFEDVLKEFAAKKCVKLGKLLKERGGLGVDMMKKKKDSSGIVGPTNNRASLKSNNGDSVEREHEVHRLGSHVGGGSRRSVGGGGQWRPALQSIAECNLLQTWKLSAERGTSVSVIS